jgi:hypothetical protein
MITETSGHDLEAAELQIHADFEMHAVRLEVPDQDIEILLNPAAAIDTVMRIIVTLNRLQRAAREDDRRQPTRRKP